ncbi:MAG: DNA polymerase [Minisyncoccia bacterium]
MKKLYLLDSHSLIHRAFYALPPMSIKNQPVNAIFGLSNILLKIIQEDKPDYMVACFDRPEPTFRKEQFEKYKAQRPALAPELVNQLIEARNTFNSFGIYILEKPGFEADDLIGTLVKKFNNLTDLQIVIFTGDLDSLQLVQDDKVIVKAFKKGISEMVIYDENAVINRFNLKPLQLIDYKSLAGDASDNIKGVPGIGPKTAIKLIQKYGSIENILNVNNDDKLVQKIKNNKDNILLYKKLVTIDVDVKIGDIKLTDLIPLFDFNKVLQYCEKLEFKSIIQRLIKNNNKSKEINFTNKDLSDVVFIFNKNDLFANLNNTKIKVVFDLKELLKQLEKQLENIKLKTNQLFFDLKIAAWLLDPDKKCDDLNEIAARFLKQNFNDQKELYQNLYLFLNKKLKEFDLEYLFSSIEMRLPPILLAMEKFGILVDRQRLQELIQELNKEIKFLENKIFELSGVKFNLNSSQQLSNILYNKLGIKPIKNKKLVSGLKSTSEEVLKNLINQHEIISYILNYREDFKIKTSYFDVIMKLLKEDDKLHTNFLQTNTATGRLASQKPNLQNIPQLSKWSKKLRNCFVAEKDSSFVSFDYSQLELRILAALSDDNNMKQAFYNNQDIHSLTASKIFNVPLDKVTSEMRKIGKTLNFGVIYGMGARAFSQNSGLNIEQAQEFIEEFFNNFSKIKEWQQNLINQAKTFGYITNINGRRRWFLNLNTNKYYLDERAVINMPVQSLGADIIKLAMINVFDYLTNKNLWGDKAKLLISIHDELLFEIKNDIVKLTVPEIKNIMENVINLSVPLKVDIKIGQLWGSLETFSFD